MCFVTVLMPSTTTLPSVTAITGEAKENAKALESAVKDMETISGQKAVITKAKKSIANFKIREGVAIGCKVTLRGEKMYEFADRLINLALPRVRPRFMTSSPRISR